MNGRLSDRLLRRGRAFLGVDHPIICGAMTWVSEPTLVAAVAGAGAFACLAGGNAPPAVLEEQVARTRELTDRPFGVNLITIAPAYGEHLALVERLKLPFVVFAGSFPRDHEVARVKATGAKVLTFASTTSIAERMIRYGTDALILEGSEAGGHVGHVSLTVLLQQVLFDVAEQIPVFVAGGVATGRMCAHLLMMGAAGVQLGTRFAVARESTAHPAFKRAFLRAKARDAVATPQMDSRLPVVAVRSLRNEGLDEFARLQLSLLRRLDEGSLGRAEAQAQVEAYWAGALRRAVVDGDTTRGSLMAGQSVGLVEEEEPVADIVADLMEGIETEVRRVRGLLCD